MPQEIKIRANDPQFAVSSAINKIVKDYAKGVKQCIPGVLRRLGASGAKEIRAAAEAKFPVPGRKKVSGRYAQGWTYKLTQQRTNDLLQICNSTKPGLAHLLEHGHATVRKDKTYDRAPAYVHIAPVASKLESEAVQEILKEVGKVD